LIQAAFLFIPILYPQHDTKDELSVSNISKNLLLELYDLQQVSGNAHSGNIFFTNSPATTQM
jgi:hypothetical protein